MKIFIDRHGDLIWPFCIFTTFIAPSFIIIYRVYFYLRYGCSANINLAGIFPYYTPDFSWIGFNKIIYLLINLPLELISLSIGFISISIFTHDWGGES